MKKKPKGKPTKEEIEFEKKFGKVDPKTGKRQGFGCIGEKTGANGRENHFKMRLFKEDDEGRLDGLVG